MKHNNSIEVKVVTDITSEPLALDDIKRHLNLLFDTTGSFSFDDDDTYLNDLNSQVRDAVEVETGLTLGTKVLKAVLRNELGDIEIPCGPVKSVQSVIDCNGNILDTTQYQLRGIDFPYICWPFDKYLTVNYTAGYLASEIPKGIIRGMLEEIAYRYKFRGDAEISRADVTPGVCEGARNFLAPYKRRGWLV
jgi:hypothetical protein